MQTSKFLWFLQLKTFGFRRGKLVLKKVVLGFTGGRVFKKDKGVSIKNNSIRDLWFFVKQFSDQICEIKQVAKFIKFIILEALLFTSILKGCLPDIASYFFRSSKVYSMLMTAQWGQVQNKKET